MKKKLSITLSILASVVAFPALAQDTAHIELTQQQQAVYRQLQTKANNLNISWDEQDAVPKWVRMTNLEMSWRSENYTERAYQFLDEYGALYKIENPRQVLQEQDQKQDELGMTHLILQQMHEGVPVYAGQLRFHFRANGSISSISGDYFPDQPDINVKPTVNAQQSKQIAEQAVRDQFDITEEQLKKLELQFTEPELYFYNYGIFSKRKEGTYLVWIFSIYSEKTLFNKLFYINVHDGSVVNVINNIPTSEDIETYVLANCADVVGTLTYDENSSDENDTVDSMAADAQAWEVNEYTDLMYDYYSDTFGRDSFDDTDPNDPSDGGATIESYTHYEVDENEDRICEQFENAGWDPTNNVVAYGENYITLDVTGHELTHAVIQYSVGITEDDTLTLQNETGALNESYADIFGEFIELENGGEGDWLHREDYINGPNRDFASPNRSGYDRTLPSDPVTNNGQPAHLNEKAEAADPICAEEADNGCIHINSGITNNALYLLVEGGTNTYSGETVTGGVPREAVEQIYYHTLTTYLGISSDFEDSYNATLQACLDLNADDPTTYPISYCDSVQQAFYAVGIATEPSYLTAIAGASPESGYAPLTVDFDASDSFALNASITSYEWDLNSNLDSDGDDNTLNDIDDTGPVASYTYNTVGSVNVWLTVTDSTGNTSEDVTTIVVTNPITATFSQTGDGVPAPATVGFDASGTTDQTGTITNYSWNFGDSGTSNGPSPTVNHVYASNGNYNVGLTVTDNQGYISTYSHMVYIGTTSPTTISGTIYNDTWTAARSPYVLSGSVSVASGYTLTIEPGTIIKFLNVSSYLTVSGTLDAQGTSIDQIVFTSYKDDTNGGDTNGDGNATSPTAGNWYFFRLANNATATLDYVTVQYGGYTGTSNDYGMFWVDDNAASVTVDHSTLRYSQYHTMQIDLGSTSTITNSTISNTTTNKYGAYITGGTATLTGNTINSTNSYGVYVYNSSPTIAGNTMNNSAYGVGVTGTLSTPIITDNTFTGTMYPIYITALNSGTVFTGNTGSGNTYNAIVWSGSTSGDVTLNDSNDLVYTCLTCTVAAGTTLTIAPGAIIKFKDTFSAMVVAGTIDAQGTSTDPIVFTSIRDDNAGGDTNNDGTGSTPVAGDWYYMTFTSSSTATLDYAVIRYGGATNHATDYPMLKLDSDSTTMSNSTVSDSEYHAIGIMASPTLSNNTVTTAGSSDSGAYITSGSPILTNNTFSNSSCGVYITGTATPTLTTNTFTDNAYPIYLFNPNSGTSLSGNTGSANNVNGIMLVGSTNGDFELNMDNDLLYILASLDISAGDTLTIVPGTVLKFDYASLGSYTASLQYLRGDGTLIARGTVTEPIVFTSISDDSYGGDTNGDMAASSPSPGSWDYISLTGTASISHAIIQYGGSYHSWGPDYAMVQIGSDNVTITNSTISDSEYRGVQINATSPTITNTLINSHDSHWFTKAIYIDGGSPTITNNVITDNKYGVMIMNDALPTISGNTIDSNVNGLNAVSAISLITAENNWWGDASGPYHATSNPTGTGDTVSNNVDYSPWFTLNSDITPPADVTPRLTIRNVWTPALTVRWFNPTDADFNHVQIDRFDGTNTTTVSNNATGTTYIDTTVNYNIRYSYTLYAVDTSGNVSSGISPTAVGLRNPAPANLLLVSGDSAITATWSRSSSSSAMLGGYIVQYGTAPDALTNTVDVGNVTTTTLTGLANGTTYYVAVRAYSTSAVQSSLSTVQSATPQP